MTPIGEERSVTIARGDDPGALEGLFVAGCRPGGAVVAPPHPLYGGSMHSPVVNKIAHACVKTGLASLSFEWRGVGASSGEPSGELADAEADYCSALIHLEETTGAPVVACGYSFGAAAALRVAATSPSVTALALVAPPAPLLDGRALADFAGDALVLVGEHDAYAPPAALEAAVAAAPRARIVTIPEADHFFMAGLASIGREIADWLEARVAARS